MLAMAHCDGGDLYIEEVHGGNSRVQFEIKHPSGDISYTTG